MELIILFLEKDLTLHTSQFCVSLNLILNVYLYNGISVFLLTFLVIDGSCARNQK